MIKKNIFLMLIISLFSLSTFFLDLGCKNNYDNSKQTGNSVMNNENHMSMSPAKVDSSIIRKPGVDVSMIDVNKDDSVYQCPMDYNVISDEAGLCPSCGMNLEKVSVKDASKNVKAYFSE